MSGDDNLPRATLSPAVVAGFIVCLRLSYQRCIVPAECESWVDRSDGWRAEHQQRDCHYDSHSDACSQRHSS